jgi:hypothetical protein
MRQVFAVASGFFSLSGSEVRQKLLVEALDIGGPLRDPNNLKMSEMSMNGTGYRASR